MSEKYFVFVPFTETDNVRRVYRIFWCPKNKLWYAKSKTVYDSMELYHITYYKVDYASRELVKKYGFKWDKVNKSWYGCTFIVMEHMEDLSEFDTNPELSYTPLI